MKSGQLTERHAVEEAWLDPTGVIVDVNDAWISYGAARGATAPIGLGINWLQLCDEVGDQHSAQVADAIRTAQAGHTAATTIPCHPPTSVEWFAFEFAPAEDRIHVVIKQVRRAPGHPTPPNLSTEHGLLGSFCDPRAIKDRGAEPDHASCAGWWADVEDGDGWVCACECHHVRFGWPAWTKHQASASE